MKALHTIDVHNKFRFTSKSALNLLWTLCQGLWLRDVMAWVEDHLADKLAEEGTTELSPNIVYSLLTWTESVNETSAPDYNGLKVVSLDKH
jgi:hypothetical protein